MSRKSRMAYAVVASAALAAGTVGLSSTADAATRSHQLPGSMPSWANAAHKVGSANLNDNVTFRVYQNWRGGDAAQQYAMSVSTPGSADYGHFLTPAQFRARFAPTASTTKTLENWLTGQGFKVTSVPANRKYVEVSGSLARASKVFATGFANYRVDGQTVRGNTQPLTVPSTMSRQIQAVVGLDQSQTLVHTNRTTPPPPLFRNAPPCSEYWAQKTVRTASTPDGTKLPQTPDYPYAPCGYAGAQLQGAYGLASTISSGNDGSGVTVGVIDAYASPTIESDANTYFTHVGLPTFKKGQFRQVVTPGSYNRPENPKQDPEGWAGEETLDVEAVHTMAPGANIVYIGAPNNYRDLDAIMNRVVDNHLADIVTNSYGYAGEALPPGYIKPTLDIQAQAAAEGMSLLYSSGDNGDETGGVKGATPSPDFPASSPLVTAVGGTSLGVDASNQRVLELGWETGKETLQSNGKWSAPAYLYGSGGGTSRLFAQPDYQKGVASAISTTNRVVPDVSAVGDPNTGMLVGETQMASDGTVVYDYYRLGGTSLSSPLYAGMLALVEQKVGHEMGLANPALYAARSVSYDITKTERAQVAAEQNAPKWPGVVRSDFVNGENATDGYVYSVRLLDYDEPLTIHVRTGYDDVTGVGSPDGTAWLNAVAGAATP